MPVFETMFKDLNAALVDEAFVDQARTLVGEGRSLVEILENLDIMKHPGQSAFVAQTPDSIQAAILAAVAQNLGRETPKQMIFTWTAAYDWELRVTETRSTDVSEGGITVHVRSRYPGDAHPGTGAA
jgi:hypothetical protein